MGARGGPYGSGWSRTPSFPLPAARLLTPRAGLFPHPGIWTASGTGLTDRQGWKQHSGTSGPVMGLITSTWTLAELTLGALVLGRSLVGPNCH